MDEIDLRKRLMRSAELLSGGSIEICDDESNVLMSTAEGGPLEIEIEFVDYAIVPLGDFYFVSPGYMSRVIYRDQNGNVLAEEGLANHLRGEYASEGDEISGNDFKIYVR